MKIESGNDDYDVRKSNTQIVALFRLNKGSGPLKEDVTLAYILHPTRTLALSIHIMRLAASTTTKTYFLSEILIPFS